MPQFDIEYEFEVYCDTCGAGLCSNTTVTTTRNRNQPSIRVSVCDDCIAEQTAVIDDLKDQITDLNSTIERLENELENIKEQTP